MVASPHLRINVNGGISIADFFILPANLAEYTASKQAQQYIY